MWLRRRSAATIVAIPAGAGGRPEESRYTVAGWKAHASRVLASVSGALVTGAVNYRGIRFAAFAHQLTVRYKGFAWVRYLRVARYEVRPDI